MGFVRHRDPGTFWIASGRDRANGPESVIKCIVFGAHRSGRKEAYTYLKEFVLEKLEVPD